LGDKNQVENYLIQILGFPSTPTQTNLYQEIIKKVISYYFSQEIENYTVYSLIGSLTSPEQIIERKFREGKYKGQTYYLLKIGNEKLQARSALLTSEK
jgi:hypothetical protein